MKPYLKKIINHKFFKRPFEFLKYKKAQIGNTKLRKTIIVVLVSTILMVGAIILFISPIAKYLIEKHDVKYTGREIKTGWVYLNPFTGYIHISNFKIYESKDVQALCMEDSIFFSATSISANFGIFKLLTKTIEITELTLVQPKGIVIQNKEDLNFTDLIKKFTSKNADKTPIFHHVNILGIKILSGEFLYKENTIPINYSVKNVNIDCPGKRWDVDTVFAKFSLLAGVGSGEMKGDITVNIKNKDYRLAIIVHKFDLNIIDQYLKDLTNYGKLSASLDADFKSSGNFIDAEKATNSGLIVINDFHFGKDTTEDYASFDKLVLAIKEVSPKKHIYFYDSVIISKPYLKYERYDYLDNLQTIFGKKGANISSAEADSGKFNLVIKIAEYLRTLGKNLFKSNYKINKIAIYDGVLKYNDYSLTEKFSIEANPLFIIADSVNKKDKRVELTLRSGIRPYGNFSVNLSINPQDSTDFDLQYHLKKLPASMLNPYLISYTSFPLDRGTIEFSGKWKVRNGFIESNNHLVIIDPHISKRIKNNDMKWIPLNFIMALVREYGNVIDYEVPITGNLKNPKFHLYDVIIDILGNIFVKPPTTPYRTEVKNTENEIEKSLTLKWEMRQSSLVADQVKFVNKMTDFLIQNPEASSLVYPMPYRDKEKEYIGFFEAKKKYFLLSHNKKTQILSTDDSLEVDKMSVKDSLFVHYFGVD